MRVCENGETLCCRQNDEHSNNNSSSNIMSTNIFVNIYIIEHWICCLWGVVRFGILIAFYRLTTHSHSVSLFSISLNVFIRHIAFVYVRVWKEMTQNDECYHSTFGTIIIFRTSRWWFLASEIIIVCREKQLLLYAERRNNNHFQDHENFYEI